MEMDGMEDSWKSMARSIVENSKMVIKQQSQLPFELRIIDETNVNDEIAI